MIPSYDLEKAKEYLAKTPWPDGGITLDYVYVTDFPREEIPGLLLLEGLSPTQHYPQYDTYVLARYGG